MTAWLILVAGVLASLGCSPEVRQEPSAKAAPAATASPATTALVDVLVAYVPPEAHSVVVIDLAQARRSPPLARLVEHVLAQTGQEASIPSVAQAFVIAGMPAMQGEGPSNLVAFVDAAGGPQLLGSPRVLERSRAAHAGESAADVGDLRDALRAARATRGSAAGFVAVKLTPELQRVARDVLPDLATAPWVAGAVEVGSGVKVTAIVKLPDLTTAARIAASADLGKSFALGQLRTADPVAARAIEKVVARPVGTTLHVTANLDQAEALGLLALLRRGT